MTEVNVHEAKTHLSRLLSRVAAGEEVIISKAGRPIARLVPIQDRKAKRVPGQDEGRIWIDDDFDAPLPSEVQSLFQ
ncbi:MAG: type II toxin-antitoxin system Phd/YefM family antitoxin [Acidobacteria bacterium]|nr:MAG: type II toxin-antitoxin system Phd/YefM family antitoxin [Acidobacteriota bacterium]